MFTLCKTIYKIDVKDCNFQYHHLNHVCVSESKKNKISMHNEHATEKER